MKKEKRKPILVVPLPRITELLTYRTFMRYLRAKCEVGLSQDEAGNLHLGLTCPVANFLRLECGYVRPALGLTTLTINGLSKDQEKYQVPIWLQTFYYGRLGGSRPWAIYPTYAECLSRMEIQIKTGAKGYGDEDGEYTP